jgi:hypothetical protein
LYLSIQIIKHKLKETTTVVFICIVVGDPIIKMGRVAIGIP